MVEKSVFGRAEHLVEIFLREDNVAQAVVFLAVPSAVLPRSHDKEEAVGMHGAAELPVSVERSVEVFGVEPSACHHHGTAQIAVMRDGCARTPPAVVRGVLHKLVPEGYAVAQKAG